MPASTLLIQFKDGTPAKQARVSLGFTVGTTTEQFTNHYGEVVIQHASTGKATVYVNGRDYGTFHAPGQYAVTLK